MKIKSIYVNNFKSLVDFKIDLAKFNCLIGLNGSGKSTFLQFISFLSQIMKGNIDWWLQKREWIKEDIVSHFDNKNNRTIQFEIQFQCDDQHGFWLCDYYVDIFCSTYEKFVLGDVELEIFNRPRQLAKYVCKGSKTEKINFNYFGSIFSQLADKEITEVFDKVIQYFRSIHSFNLLSPYYLKQPSDLARGSIGFAGEDLASFLFDLNDDIRTEVINKIKNVYPELDSFFSYQLQNGTKQITITEQYRDGNIQYVVPARIANDGIMRIIAIIAQLNAKTDFLLFDEIENGINQELVDFLLKELVNAEQQIVVTTHSPLFMNYLEDELAKESVKYFYKTSEGYTRCIPFFEIPSIQEKLEVMGPGEAFADTDLIRLAHEITRCTSKREE